MYKFAIIILLLLTTIPVVAQDDAVPGNEDKDNLDLFDNDEERTEQGWVQFYISAGIAYQDADGSYKVREPDGDKVTIIDFDRVGLAESDYSHWLSLNWRSAYSRWGAWFGAWQYDVIGSRVWNDSLEIPGKDPIPVGAKVSTEFETKWYILEGTYSFHRSKTVDTGIGFGVHAVDLKTILTARIELAEARNEAVSEKLDSLAPLPNLLGYLHWKFAPDWSFVGRVGWFGMDYKKYSGQMVNAHTMLNYEVSPRVALGVGYQFVRLDLTVDRTEYEQIYDMDFSGPLAYLRFHF
jgi:hypothetical protein